MAVTEDRIDPPSVIVLGRDGPVFRSLVRRLPVSTTRTVVIDREIDVNKTAHSAPILDAIKASALDLAGASRRPVLVLTGGLSEDECRTAFFVGDLNKVANESGIERVLFVSSMEVAGGFETESPLTADAPVHPSSPLGHSASGLELAFSFWGSGSVTALRTGDVVDEPEGIAPPSESHRLLSALIDKNMRDLDVPAAIYLNGATVEPRRNLVTADSVAVALVDLIDRPSLAQQMQRGPALASVASPESVSLEELVVTAADALQSSVELTTTGYQFQDGVLSGNLSLDPSIAAPSVDVARIARSMSTLGQDLSR